MSQRLARHELRNRSSEVLREVAAGVRYEISDHGEFLAILAPPPAGWSCAYDLRAFVEGSQGYGERGWTPRRQKPSMTCAASERDGLPRYIGGRETGRA